MYLRVKQFGVPDAGLMLADVQPIALVGTDTRCDVVPTGENPSMTAVIPQAQDLDAMHDELFRQLGELEAQVDSVLSANGIQTEPKVQLADLAE